MNKLIVINGSVCIGFNGIGWALNVDAAPAFFLRGVARRIRQGERVDDVLPGLNSHHAEHKAFDYQQCLGELDRGWRNNYAKRRSGWRWFRCCIKRAR